MCLSPITIQSNARYYLPHLSSAQNVVPCGRCASCRDARKSTWEDRLCLEVAEWYKNGGIGLMLTFTYNNACLPHFEREGISVPCFSSSDILAFLDRVKTRSRRMFGNDFYRHFVCSEYGKNTQRPHYHSIFLIRDGKRYNEFVEMCRECWCWLYERDKNGHYKPSCSLGFMFPKLGKFGVYVDDKGRNKDPRFRSQKAGAKYVCKYICKDLAYMKNDDVTYFYEKYPEFRNCCPKSYKSNNIGFAPVSRIVANGTQKDIEDLITKGVWSPLQQKYVKLWDSAISRLMYDNIHFDLYSIKTRKKVYERVLSNFGAKWLWFNFKQRVERVTQKMYERMLLVSRSGLKFKSDFTPSQFGLSPLFLRSSFKKHALWHCLLKQFSPIQLKMFYYKFGDNEANFWNVDFWENVYYLRHDNISLSDMLLTSSMFPDIPIISDKLTFEELDKYRNFEDNYCRLSRALEEYNLYHYSKRGEAIEKAKHIQGAYGYDEKLC